ncbi:thioredoxin reductase (NADPH) [Tissierella praeacuta]|uniref:thioredoxin-disulfide reductase n=1 Tax=Tissierella praeacuta TaxID=43131 RepID=UPI00104CC356|nr:thioredoxin-disulfide reductase [Tissierella praeacuta]TCU77332.1 thioredoxin reductase (NADPH) [Tissierella praeacuta]
MSKKHEEYDVVIIGGGSAGLTAAIYSGRANLNTLVIEQALVGGLITSTNDVENYPGFPEGISGIELTKLFHKQAKKYGVKFKLTDVRSVDFSEEDKIVETFRNVYHAKTVIIATGVKPKLIGCPGEVNLIGKGISYCSTCDANLCIGKDVYCIGGGDSAVEEAIYLTKFANKVTLIHRREELRAAKSIQEKAFKTENLNFIWNSIVKEIKGTDCIEAIILENTNTGKITTISSEDDSCSFMIFPYIGTDPVTAIFKDKVNMDHGYIITDEKMKTNIPGVFAAGDCRVKSLRQVVTAAGDGAIAAIEAEKYIDSL